MQKQSENMRRFLKHAAHSRTRLFVPVVEYGLTEFAVTVRQIIPKDSVLRSETAIKVNKYLLVAHGTEAEVAKAKDILATTKPAQLDEHVLGTTAASVTA